jgi:hypothetical protein
MAHLPWVDFLQLHPSPHLVAAIILPSRSSNHLLRLRRILANVIEEGRPVADFATAIVRPTEVAQIHCAFVDKNDADRLAELTQARNKPAESPWASHRAFTLSAASELALADRLASTKRGPNAAPGEATGRKSLQ